MGISIGSVGDSYIQNLQNQASTQGAAAKTQGLSSAVDGLSQNSSKEEIEEAVKTFEAYFVEQILKQMKESVESINKDDKESSFASSYVDTYMDYAIGDIATDIVDKYAGTLTEDMVAQIQRNYGITDTDA